MLFDDQSLFGVPDEVRTDILEGYIRTSERFRVIQVFFGVPESYRISPGEVVGLNGPYGKGEKGLKGWLRAPHGLIRIGLGGGDTPSFLLPSSSFPSFS